MKGCPLHSKAVKPSRLSGIELENRILDQTRRAIEDFELISEGDSILVAVSGGKDSYTLLHMLEQLRRVSEKFSLTAVNIHHGFPGYRADEIEAHLEAFGFDYRMCHKDIAGLLEEKLKPTQSCCSFCARLRRGVLYDLAPALGCNKIALGHHQDDLIETLLLNIFYTGQLKSMPPLLKSDDGRNLVIRPMAYVLEADIAAYAQMREFPIVCCSCPACGVRDNQQRRAIKALLARTEDSYPGIKDSLLKAIGDVVPTHLMDPTLRKENRR